MVSKNPRIKSINHERNRRPSTLYTISWVFDFSDVGFGRVAAGDEGQGGEPGEGGANEF